MTDDKPRPEQLQHPEVSYENRDLSVPGVLAFLLSLVLIGVIASFVLLGMYRWLDHYQQSHQRPPNPLETAHAEGRVPTAQAAERFPQPRLQPDPVADLNKFREHNEQILNSYGWVDPNAGVAHIPIEKAIDIIAARGLPVRQAPLPTPAAAPVPGGGPGNQAQKSPATSK